MKRLSFIIPCLMLLSSFLTAIGAPVLEHYCEMKEEQTQSCPMHAAKTCCEKKEAPKDDCCKDEIAFKKFSSDYLLKNFKTDVQLLKIECELPRELTTHIAFKNLIDFTYDMRGSPPIARDIPVFIQSFLI
jgi:hypothetical protein